MVDDARLEEYRELWTKYLQDYILIEYDGKAVICNRDTQMPLMIEEDLREIVTHKFIEAGIESIRSDNDT